MNRQFWLSLVAMMALVASGCGEDPADLDTGTGTETDAGNYDDNIVEGGGTEGGPIDGLLVIWFFDAATGDPIQGTLVQVGDDAATGLTETADENGRVVFQDASLSGPVNFHYMADGYTNTSVYGFNATYITIDTYPDDYLDPAPDTVEITGSVDGFDLVPTPAYDQIRFAIVGHSLSLDDFYSGEYDDLEQDEGDLPSNMIAEGIQDTFTLEAHNRKGTLYALAGLLTFLGEDDVAMELIHLGYFAGFDPETDSLNNVQIDLTEALDEVLNVEISPFASEYAEASGIVLVDLGEDGTIPFLGGSAVPGPEVTFQVPDLDAAPFGDKGNTMILFAGPGGYEEYPTGIRQAQNVSGAPGGGDTMMVDGLLPPPRDIAWNGDQLSFTLTSDVDFASFDFDWGSGAWEVITVDTTSTVTAPTLPSAWGFDLPPTVSVGIWAEAYSLNADPNNVAFNTLFEKMISASSTAVIIE